MDPVEVLRLLGGTAPRAAILRHSSRAGLERAVAQQEIEHLSRGRYALPGLPVAIKAAATIGATVSHTSAAAHWLLEGIAKPAKIHLTVPKRAHPRWQRSVTLHYADLDEDSEVTSPLRTVLDCARTLPFREGLAIADSALRMELVGKEDLLEGARRLVGPGSPGARQVVRHSDGLAANPFESALRAATIEAGLLGFVPQVVISDDGLDYRVDLADEKHRLVAEADSLTHHATPEGWERDCRRYDELVSRNWHVLRYAWEQVMFDEAWVKKTLLATHQLAALRSQGKLRRPRPPRGQ